MYPPIFHFLRDFGIYVFSFYKDCEWLYVIVDDFLPCDIEGELLFASCKQSNRFWVSLIEKAYAKLNYNYHNLINGLPEEAIYDLTGLPSKRYKFRRVEGDDDRGSNKESESKVLGFNNKDELWRKLHEFYLAGYMMACGSEKPTSGKGSAVQGIIPGHAYSIHEIYEFKVPSLNPAKRKIN